jgi:hypothetical protein
LIFFHIVIFHYKIITISYEINSYSFNNNYYILFIIENEDNRSDIASTSKSSDSNYVPDLDMSDDSDIDENTTISKTGNQDLSKKSNNTSLETSLPLGTNASDDSNMYVQETKNGNKKDFCIYCKTEQAKLSHHLIRKHKDLKEIQDIVCIPKGRPERRMLINKIRKTGQYHFNTNSDINTGELKDIRRPSIKSKKEATVYANTAKVFLYGKLDKFFFENSSAGLSKMQTSYS